MKNNKTGGSTAKILYFNPSNELYGADRSLLRLVKGVDPAHFQPLVILPKDISYEGLLTNELEKNKIEYRELQISVLRRRYFSFFGMFLFIYRTIISTVQLVWLCHKENIKLIHTNSTAVLVGGLVARITRIPHVWHVREIIVRPEWLNKFITFLLYYLADTIVAVSNPVKENLVKAVPKIEMKTIVVHNGLELNRFSNLNQSAVNEIKSSWNIPTNSQIIGMIGRFSTWKGQAYFVESVSQLLREQHDLHAVMVGGDVPGETRHRETVLKQIEQLQLNDRIHIKPFSLNIPNILNSFDVFVLPSTLPDPFPTVVLEAMAASCPIVATAHGGALEQVVDGTTGFLVSHKKSKEMYNALNKLIKNNNLRIKMGKAGRNRLEKFFTVNVYVKNIMKIY